jgi:hypothetical protein
LPACGGQAKTKPQSVGRYPTGHAIQDLACSLRIRQALILRLRQHLMHLTLFCEVGLDHRDSYPIRAAERARQAQP